jgi:hypothetical protein
LNRDGIIFVFGAGASRAENAPMASELLYKTLTSTELENDGFVVDLKDFLKEFFYVNINDLGSNPLPTFEEVLTVVDIALARQDDFSSRLTYETLLKIRDNLIYSIAKILEIHLREGGGLHRTFVDKLFFNSSENIWRRASFVNLNYDLLLDNALLGLHDSKNLDLDYSIDFRNFVEHDEQNQQERIDFIQNPEDWFIPRPGNSVLLLKPHGSLNWLYCPNCNTVKTIKTEKALKVWTERVVCERDHSHQKTLLIPPTWEKAYDNAHLNRIAQKTYEVLKKAKNVFFVGYSLADVDIRLKYLFKKALYDPDQDARPEIMVVLMENGNQERNREVEERYSRFFGSDVKFDFRGFEYFSVHLNEFLA